MQSLRIEGKTAERTVRFYRVSLGRNPDGSYSHLDLRQTLSEIETLPFTRDSAQKSRYLQHANGRIEFTLLSTDAMPLRFKYYRGSRLGLPEMEDGGHIEGLPLADNAGLVEAVHGVFFPPDILALETVGGDSLAISIAKYIRAKGPLTVHSLAIEPLVHRDVVARLMRLKEISLFKFSIKPSFLETVRSVDRSLAAGMASLAEIWNDQTAFEVIIRPTKSSRQSVIQRLLPSLTRIATLSNLANNSVTCQVNGVTEGSARTQVIDLLTDKLTAKKDILLKDSRYSALDEGSAYQAIDEAYDDLQMDIAEALGAGIWEDSANGGSNTSLGQRPSQLSLFRQE